ncbi:PREDICTED: alpha-ketoglutarate-dependent dioxygenase alkB homolog 7, mitochondrial [Nicrophorus vespilloides]|uniref:Alpha-ketoglutarate-dependent dioxygenase alkB homolog 7, mitochondrial n=1 Tax=Nicrophorus vespilloides TaxID=110193 RepID=A0ABM1M674_NICVS|nr:PREDICTED: alpha-ketoglutarate-dependent dioxygenase alkB homolog 7, mitochondrial [Nicrophorus vespilloides]
MLMKRITPNIVPKISKIVRHLQTVAQSKKVYTNVPANFVFSKGFHDPEQHENRESIVNSMLVHADFLTEVEENSIFGEIEPYLKRMRYEYDHWDNAIHGFRETERVNWNKENTCILDRVRNLAFPAGVNPLRFVHILDLDEKGYIKPHIDAIRFCGDTIAGLSLLTDSVMRLVHDKNKDLSVDILLKRRSLYIMKGTARFDYTHEILGNEHSKFNGETVLKTRRISVICRNEPDPENTKL